MRVFHNDPRLKQRLLASMRTHAAADEIIKGKFWHQGKGCFIGCAVKVPRGRRWRGTFARLYGIDQKLVFLLERIFEGLPEGAATDWVFQSLDALTVGSDVSSVTDQFLYWLLTDEDRLLRYADEHDERAIQAVAELYQRRLAGDEPTHAEWLAAAAVAVTAATAASSTGSTAAAAVASAASYAAEAGAYASNPAAAALRTADTVTSAADTAAYLTMRDKLLALIKAT